MNCSRKNKNTFTVPKSFSLNKQTNDAIAEMFHETYFSAFSWAETQRSLAQILDLNVHAKKTLKRLSLLAESAGKFVKKYIQPLSSEKMYQIKDYNLYDSEKGIFLLAIVRKNIFVMNLSDPSDWGKLMPMDYALPPCIESDPDPDLFITSFYNHIPLGQDKIFSLIASKLPRFSTLALDTWVLIDVAPFKINSDNSLGHDKPTIVPVSREVDVIRNISRVLDRKDNPWELIKNGKAMMELIDIHEIYHKEVGYPYEDHLYFQGRFAQSMAGYWSHDDYSYDGHRTDHSNDYKGPQGTLVCRVQMKTGALEYMPRTRRVSDLKDSSVLLPDNILC